MHTSIWVIYDSFFNPLGNIYLEEFKLYSEAEDLYKKAVISIQYMKKNEDNEEKPLVNIGRVYNLIGETFRQRNKVKAAIEYYAMGIENDFFFIDNYEDIAESASLLKEESISNLFFFIQKILTNEIYFIFEEKSKVKEGVEIIRNNLKKEIIPHYFVSCLKVIREVLKKLMTTIIKFDENDYETEIEIIEYCSQMSELQINLLQDVYNNVLYIFS